jgi:predicted glycosyltransferase involved in capsule biosynthesis
MAKPLKFAIVIPTAFRVRGREIRQRALALLHSRQFEGQELIVSHGSHGNDSRFCRDLEAAGARVAVTPLTSTEVPLGLLRNRGVEIATATYVLFWDVDLLPPINFLDDLRRWLDVSPRPFAIIPCLYASRLGTRQFVTGGAFDSGRALAAFYGHRRDLVLHLALNTSTVAIERNYFLEVGGFDERYLDHGLEDLDLLLRLALRDDSLPVPSDLLTDVRHQSPAFSTGFRSMLNLLSLPVLLESVVTLHQWHSRPRASHYYRRRDANWQLFEENARRALRQRPLGSIVEPWRDVARPDGTLDSLLVVHRLLGRSASYPNGSSALFDEVPQHYFHPDRTRRRVWHRILGSLVRRKTS